MYLKSFYKKNGEGRMLVTDFENFTKEIIDKFKEPAKIQDVIQLLKMKIEDENYCFVETFFMKDFDTAVKLCLLESRKHEFHKLIDWSEHTKNK